MQLVRVPYLMFVCKYLLNQIETKKKQRLGPVHLWGIYRSMAFMLSKRSGLAGEIMYLSTSPSQTHWAVQTGVL